MRAFVMCALLAGLMAITLVAGVGAESSVELTVRLYNSSRIPIPELVAARRAAGSILRDTGLDVVFRHCTRPVSAADPIDTCQETLKPSEVVVRIIAAPTTNTTLQPDVYGVAYVVQATNRGWLATVFSDRIDEAATRVSVDPGMLLGRVMAHEVGHLLLGSGYHAEAGLMRATWPDALLSRDAAQWRFSMIEAAKMHRMLVSFAHDPRAIAPAL